MFHWLYEKRAKKPEDKKKLMCAFSEMLFSKCKCKIICLIHIILYTNLDFILSQPFKVNF